MTSHPGTPKEPSQTDALRGPDGSFTAGAALALFDRAVLRFNAEEFHRAHEDWEPLWHETTGPRRVRLQGLIQVAAAFHFFREGSAASFEGLLRSGAPMAAAPDAGLGIDAAALARALAPWVEHAARVAEGADLRAGAPGAFPRIVRLPGVAAAPLAPEVEVSPGPRRWASSRGSRSVADRGGSPRPRP